MQNPRPSGAWTGHPRNSTQICALDYTRSVTSRTRSKHVIGYVARNVVASHDFLHLALILCDIVAIALPAMLRPVLICLIELLLIVVRKPSLKLASVVMVRVSTRRGNHAERCIRWNLVARHDVFHLAGVLVDVVAIVFVIGFLPFFVVLIEFPLVIRRKPALPCP